MKRCHIPAVACYSLLLVSSLGFLGCEVGSSDSVTRNVGANYTGYYDAPEGFEFVTPANSGARVTSFILRQSGDQLQAIDNNNLVFNGSLDEVSVASGNSDASFTMTGRTTAGQDVNISGTFKGVGTAGTIDGTWIEADRYCRLYGTGDINPAPTSQPSTVTISASVSTLTTNNATATLTANGGSGTYSSWTVSAGGNGSVSPTSGKTVTYTRIAMGNVTVTVTDSASQQGQITISQP
jgi:hypothetical protein